MSLYTFATTNFTTESDRRRRAFIDGGQLLRTVALFALILATLVLAAPRSDAGDAQAHLDAGSAWLAPHATTPLGARVTSRAHKSLPAARF